MKVLVVKVIHEAQFNVWIMHGNYVTNLATPSPIATA